jgi:RHH-type transcriptional regulator, rel operon repressor / antitoxin RelB
MLCVQLDESLEKKLDDLCAATARNREDCLREALENYIEDMEDIIIATGRLNDGEPAISLEEARRLLDLDR